MSISVHGMEGKGGDAHAELKARGRKGVDAERPADGRSM